MKKTLVALAAFLLTTFSTAPAQAINLEKDVKLIEAMTSNEFINELIYFEHSGKKYPIRIIWNPKGETLWGKFQEPTNVSLIVLANIPIPVARYVEDLVLELRGSYDDCQLSLKNENPEEEWDNVRPIYIAESIQDTINDEIIRDTFHSKTFENKVIYYHIAKEYYKVRLMNNPEGRTFSETKHYNLSDYGPEDFTLTWNNKYAILIDYEAPEELVDHLSDSLRHLSYWDWYFNYTLSNGTYVEFSYTRRSLNYTDTTTWALDTWFDFTENFKPN